MALEGTSATSAIPEPITCDGSDLDLTQAFPIQATPSQDPSHTGWLWFNNISVNNEMGTRLYQGEHPLRAGRIQIFATDVAWRYGFSFSTAVRTPLGRSTVTDEGFRFPGLFRYGLVLFQPQSDGQLRAWQISATHRDSPQNIDLDPNLDILVAVNDDKGRYGDNSGSVDLNVKVL